MRFALPFSRAQCGAFSCAACIAAFSSFSYAVCAAIYASAVCRSFLMRFALPFARARCGAFSCAVCAAAFGNFSYAVFLMRFAPPPIQTTINFFPHSPSGAFPLAKTPAPWLFLCAFSFALCAAIFVSFSYAVFPIRLALPFSQARCGAFSCAICIATFGNFSYAAFLLRFALPFAAVFLMRLALPFTQMQCGAFSCAVCSVRYCPLKGCLPAALPPAPLRPAGQTRRAPSQKSAPPGHPRPAG